MFREKRIYGDREDFELFAQQKNKEGVNCRILVNEYYSHGGYPYQNNDAAENDPTNYIQLSVESVEEAIKNFTIGSARKPRPLERGGSAVR
ncbi:MAG: hypothetical protein BAJALOKI1v1_2060007 [Promethearchaeota archaeon]|nr:MAG: hypothetical protein BAJALOKI1v1_2060007 [Candidatus Lokiarchaeota archaeon]